jgi:hypothetical protein
MKIVREYLEFEKYDFERTGNPQRDLRIGMVQYIERWLEDMGFHPENYKLNPDLSIDVFDDVNIVSKGLTELPEYIKFGNIGGGFYAAGNNWTSLRGFPEEVWGDFQLRSPSSPQYYPTVKQFSEEEIRKLIKIHGKIYN